ncbi:VOC family protein [Ideonella sp. 4Y11]|uniref:VOC family protein n=1 Tax=Ideonella aquatica TaxID=2824119 RepID=A0A941BKZ2_9BURK|nr:VOC family protein [Ideonella aquatica]MBQ0959144.1 VOC family protein [Ideonella aquatica]
MQHTEVDHLVVAAATLAQAAAWAETTLGVTPQPGGRHALMSTHNLLLGLAGSVYPQSYLELIAIDPEAPAPGRARWFGLDDGALQARLAAQGPELVGFVARSGMVDMHRWGLINARFQPGPILSASRETPEGLLSWKIVVADDGRPLAGGAVPTLIQWSGTHPAERLAPSGLDLTALTVRGLPDLAHQVLRLRPLTREPLPGPALQATLITPRGPVILTTAQHAPG